MNLENNNIINKLRLLGESGTIIDGAMLSGKNINKNIFNGKEIKIFDFYNTNKDGENANFLDENELQKMFSDLLAADTDKSETFLPVEIKDYINDKIGKKINASNMVDFLNKIANYCNSEELSKNGFEEKILNNISSYEIIDLINNYEKNTGENFIDNLYDVNWFRRKDLLDILKNKIVECAELRGIDSKDFQEQFDAVVKDSWPIFGAKENAEKMKNVLNNFIEKIIKKEKLYNDNRNGILNILSDPKLCYSTEDLNPIIDKIMKYSEMYNPKEALLKSLESNNSSKSKKIMKELLDSKFLDYYPIYIASLIGQESQFREQDEKVFTKNGQGVMQVTQTIVDDIFNRPGLFDNDFILEIKSKYANSTELYNAIIDPENVDLNYKVGAAGLKAKLFDAIRMVASDKYKILKIDSPEKILELTAMNYNSNKDAKKDPTYSNKLSQVRYVYARDILLRFKKYTPSDITIKNYYEYNPTTKKWVYKNF